MKFITPTQFKKPSIRTSVTNITESYISDDHTAEGFLVKWGNKILNIFRLDPGLSGDHIGNTGKVVKRESFDDGNTWSEPVTIHEDEYDNRNVHGGILESGRIVAFTRTYDADAGRTINTTVLYSDDGGDSWSKNIMNTGNIVFGTGKIDYIPEIKKYIAPNVISGFNSIRFSADGVNWDEEVVIHDYRSTGEHAITEMALAYVGNGRLIAISRDNKNPPEGYQHYQTISEDYGQTWSKPIRTNVPEPFGRTAPFLVWDEHTQSLILLTSDRRTQIDSNLSRKEESIYIYVSRVDEVFNNPDNWHLIKKIKRPKQDSNSRFYGYPHCTKVDNGEYLVMFTDSYTKNGEVADFYQINLNIELGFVS